DKHAGRAGLMFPEDKTKLDKMPEITSIDADKVLTVNSSGTAAEWKEVAPTGGGGVLMTYHPGDNKKIFVRATGPGVNVNMTVNNVTVTIPSGVHLDYLKISITSMSEINNEQTVNFEIVDE